MKQFADLASRKEESARQLAPPIHPLRRLVTANRALMQQGADLGGVQCGISAAR